MDYLLIDLAQYGLDGILKGLLYAVVAIAFIVIYRSGRIFNLAQGEIVIFMAYIIWTLVAATTLPMPIALILSVALTMIVGLVIERSIFRPLIGQEMWSIVMASVGLMILTQGIVQVAWGGAERPFPNIFPEEPVIIGQLIFSSSIFWGGLISLLLVIALNLGFTKTRWGLKLTAVAEDHLTAQSMGISVSRSIAIAWMMGCVLSGFAAIVFLNGQTLTFAAASIGLQALPVVLLAGIESIPGAVFAGIIVGVGESMSAAYMDGITDGAASEAFPFILMLLVLVIRPQGLFGWKIIERV